jgi:hypothetical protein
MPLLADPGPGASLMLVAEDQAAAGPLPLGIRQTDRPRRVQVHGDEMPGDSPRRAALALLNGGKDGIRTHGCLATSTVFETAPFVHSGTLP